MARMPFARGMIICCFLLARALPAPAGSEPASARIVPGVVIQVGGVGGIGFMSASTRYALPRAGLPHEIRDFVWTHGKGHVFLDLQDTRHCLSKAQELADQIRKIKEDQPGRPVYLMAHSGGCALSLAAAEMLPDRTIERIILLSAAVSPTYDLRPALKATNYGIISFYSRKDHLILGWGTKHFGTMDRYYGPSAGYVGFSVPTNLGPDDRLLYARLVQLPWYPKLILEGNSGGHNGSVMPGFLAKEVVPWLKP
jgi:pimeloyl-ACP methyl ester carboxylesterase